MKKYFKFIVVFVLTFSILLSFSYAFSLSACAYSVSDTLDDIISLNGDVIQNGIGLIRNGVDTSFRILNRAIDNVGDFIAPSRVTNIPTSDTVYKSDTVTYFGDEYCVNYYAPTSNNYNTYNYAAYDYTYNNYVYNTVTNTYNTVNNVYKYNTNNFNSYSYEYNDNRTFVTETFNSITYINIDPTAHTVDCYICSFTLPSGDDSFNYSSEYCYGLYWCYDVLNYNRVADTSSFLALFRLDGDYSNEIADSEWSISYNSGNYSGGRFGDSLRLNGSIPFQLVSSSDVGDYTLDYWYYNGETDNTEISIGWHWFVFQYSSSDSSVELWIDGVKTERGSSLGVRFDFNVGTFIDPDGRYIGYVTNPFSVVSFSTHYSRLPQIPLYIAGSSPIGIYWNLKDGVSPTDFYSYFGIDSSYMYSSPTFNSRSVYFDFTSSSLDNCDVYFVNEALQYNDGYIFRPLSYGNNITHSFGSIPISGMTSNSFIDEIRIRDGHVYSSDSNNLSIPTSRQEFEYLYVPPSSANINDIAIQSIHSFTKLRIGGVIPTVPFEGYVWLKLVNGVCSEALQYYEGAWHNINFSVYNGSYWRNGYDFNFYTMTFGSVDGDTGTLPTSVYNYYYGDTYNVYNDYFKDNQSDKENAISWWTSLIGLISGAFTAIVPFLTGYLGFLPVWLTVPFLTFIPILLILLIVKIKDIFK